MTSVIFDPLEEFEGKLKALHDENTHAFFESLVQQSGVDIEKNRQTVRLYKEYRENLKKLRKKLNWRRFWRVLMCITLVLIPFVILRATPKIKTLRDEIESADRKAEELLEEAWRQMRPLNELFTDRDALQIIEKTMPLLSFATYFSVEQEEDMRLNYDFCAANDMEQSTIDVLAGKYNDNPFVFENKLIHTMGTETYHGYKTIHWTETYRDSNGNMQTRTQTQTLHATVTKPKPFYHTQVVLSYCAQGGPDLSFTRDATNLDDRSEKAIERYVKRGERRLKQKTDKAIAGDGDFMSMSNSEFEVLFDALDRTNEVQFRTLFTPLAQTNMVNLLLSKTGYGDDFHFLKQKRTNQVISQHSQGRTLNLLPQEYVSYSYDFVEENFITKNMEYFKAVYFDFAPLLAIPIYQERPVHSLKPIPDHSRLYSLKECEALTNAVDKRHVVHPGSKTHAIVKSAFVVSRDGVDETAVTAYSYDIAKRVAYVSVHGGDGRWHNVPVEWDEYLPLVFDSRFSVCAAEKIRNQKVMARRSGICIFQS